MSDVLLSLVMQLIQLALDGIQSLGIGLGRSGLSHMKMELIVANTHHTTVILGRSRSRSWSWSWSGSWSWFRLRLRLRLRWLRLRLGLWFRLRLLRLRFRLRLWLGLMLVLWLVLLSWSTLMVSSALWLRLRLGLVMASACGLTLVMASTMGWLTTRTTLGWLPLLWLGLGLRLRLWLTLTTVLGSLDDTATLEYILTWTGVLVLAASTCDREPNLGCITDPSTIVVLLTNTTCVIPNTVT